jgi:hypothetical protein
MEKIVELTKLKGRGKSVIALLFLSAVLSACQSSVQSIEGYLVGDWENSIFFRCNSSERWDISAEDDKVMNSLERQGYKLRMKDLRMKTLRMRKEASEFRLYTKALGYFDMPLTSLFHSRNATAGTVVLTKVIKASEKGLEACRDNHITIAL